MTTLLMSHDACLGHDPGPRHPESPDRLRAVLAALDAPEFAGLIRRTAPLATAEQLALVHEPGYIDWVFEAIPETGYGQLDADTIVSPGSKAAALHAAGAVCAAVDGVMDGTAATAFCAVRPPGHHAEPARAMGFCLFNNVAIGARYAQSRYGISRVAVVDFDVHHGNGTEAAFAGKAGLFYTSTHQFPHYPGTGAAGTPGAENILNLPLAPGTGSEAFRAAVSERMIPALIEFSPEIVLISAGFDAHESDPLAELNLTEADYTWITEELLTVARASARGRVVSTLEGGYHLEALATSAAAHVRALAQA